jgi:hypothetical protein
MRIDPKLLELSAAYKAARDKYDEYIKQFAHPVQWPLLSREKQQEWYNEHLS